MSFTVPKLPKGLLKPMVHIEDSQANYIGGILQPPTTTTTDFQGHITPLTEKDLKYDTNGAYTTSDYKLYCDEDFENNTKITYLSETWTIMGTLDYLELGTFRRYVIKRVGVTSES